VTPKTAVVITSIADPVTRAVRHFAEAAVERGFHFVLIGDAAGPAALELPGCDFYSLFRQQRLDFAFARACPTRSYARKNIGYLIAAAAGAEIIVESDDDNEPLASFWQQRRREHRGPVVSRGGWINVHRFFDDQLAWPRGLPLTVANAPQPRLDEIDAESADCPIQQGLVSRNPDVDAVYRMLSLPAAAFAADRSIAVGAGTWSPFNSQNTAWFRCALPLMYLPATCSMRLTDIWRSFVSQRVAWECGWEVLFRSPDMEQFRNQHDLVDDFRQEVDGHLYNAAIADALGELDLRPGVENLHDNLRACWKRMVAMEILAREELDLLDLWLADLDSL